MHQRAGDRDLAGCRSGTPSRLRVLHVVVQAGPTNSQWNEHCLPVADERDLTVCSLFPATVSEDHRIARVEGDGSVLGALRVLRRTLSHRNFDVVHVHAPASAALLLAAYVLERRPPREVVFTLHNSWPNIRPRNQLLAALATAALPVTVACSRSAASSIPAWLQKLVGRKIQVVPNGVDIERIDHLLASSGARAEAAQPAEPRRGVTIVTVGRLIPIKNHEALLAAFARVAADEDQLHVVGEGSLRPRLEQQAVHLGIDDRTRFLGLLPRGEVYRVMRQSDIFVSPSYGEGLPLSVMEAMASGLPVLLSDIPPHRELALGDGAATLVPADDVDALAASLAALRDMSPGERAHAGAGGRRAVIQNFSLHAMANGYDRVYSDVASRRIVPKRERP